MIVEDHVAVRNSLKHWLEAEFPCVFVKEAESGEEAVSISRADSPDIIIMDVGLPHMNGIEAAKQIKLINSDTKIVMLTIYEDEAHRRDAEAAGADAYVCKRLMQADLRPVLETFSSENERKNDR